MTPLFLLKETNKKIPIGEPIGILIYLKNSD